MSESLSQGNSGIVNREFSSAAAGVLMYMLAPLGMTLIPLVVGGAAKDLGFSDTQVGFLASADLMGLAVASVSSVFWIHKISWRVVGLVSTLIIIVGNALSMAATSFELLCVARFTTELGSGGVFSLALVTLGAAKNPDRYFAVGIGMTIALSVCVFLWLPSVIESTGLYVVFLFHGAVALCALPSVAWLIHGESAKHGEQENHAVQSYGPLFLCFAAFFCFTIAEGGVWSYIERIGDSAGLSTEYVGQVLAMSQVASLAAAILATVLSTRFGRSFPIGFAILIFIVGLVLLLQPNSSNYMIAACLTQFAYIFVIPYMLLMCVELDPSRHYVVLTTAFKMGGFSVGPAVVAMFLGGSGYSLVSWIGIFFLVVCSALVLPLAFKLDRSTE